MPPRDTVIVVSVLVKLIGAPVEVQGITAVLLVISTIIGSDGSRLYVIVKKPEAEGNSVSLTTHLYSTAVASPTIDNILTLVILRVLLVPPLTSIQVAG